MTKKLVEIGKIYTAKISGKLLPVRIDRDRDFQGGGRMYGGIVRKTRHSGWDATNMASGRKVHIRTAAKLRESWHAPEYGENYVGR